MTGDESRTGYEIEIEPEVRVWLQNCPVAEPSCGSIPPESRP
ncbi:hypothetical protein [Kitasatospora sp. NPDC093102]